MTMTMTTKSKLSGGGDGGKIPEIDENGKREKKKEEEEGKRNEGGMAFLKAQRGATLIPCLTLANAQDSTRNTRAQTGCVSRRQLRLADWLLWKPHQDGGPGN